MKVGYLKSVMRDGKEELHGEIRTLDMHKEIRGIPNQYKNSDNAPDYIILSTGLAGQVQIGGIWRRCKEQIGKEPFHFLSITIDDMSMPYPLNVAGFINPDGNWDITWRRRVEK